MQCSQAEKEIKALERSYVDALIEKDDRMARDYKRRMEEEKATAFHEIHIDLIFKDDDDQPKDVSHT